MEFSNPMMLWGMLGASIPLIIHLIQFKRYKTIHFSDIQFLKQVQRSAVNRNRIKNWLLLIVRMLAWCALTLAFAMPFYSSPSSSSQSDYRDNIILVVDNSPSTGLPGETGPIWTEVHQIAESIIRYNPAAQFHLLSADWNGSDAVSLSSDAAINELNSITTSNGTMDLNAIVNRASTYGLKDSATVVVVSDVQRSAYYPIPSTTLPLEWKFFPVQGLREPINYAIDSLWFSSPIQAPGSMSEVSFQIVSYGVSQWDELPVELWVDGELRGAKSISSSSSIFTGSFNIQLPQSSSCLIEVRLQDENVRFDNSRTVVLELPTKLSILHIQSDWPGLSLENRMNDENLQFENVTISNVPFSRLSDFDLIVVDRAPSWPEELALGLRNALKTGSSVVLFPEGPSGDDSRQLNIPGYLDRDTTRQLRFRLNNANPYFDGMFYESPENIQLPPLEQRTGIASHPKSSPLIYNGQRETVLSITSVESGFVYQWNAHIEEHASGWIDLYTAMFYQFALYKPYPRLYSFEVNSQDNIDVVGSFGEGAIQIIQDSTIVIPAQTSGSERRSVSLNVVGLNPGIAFLTLEDDTLQPIGLYLAGPESDLLSMSEADWEELKNQLGATVFKADTFSNLDNQLRSAHQTETTSDRFALLFFILLVIEMVVWRRKKLNLSS